MKLIVLDRDGVINKDRPDYVKSVDEWIPIPGSISAMAQLTRAGFEIVIATNQSGIGRGLYSAEAVAAIHRRIRLEAAQQGARIAGFYICPHAPSAGCNCRKPAPGLLQAIARDHQVSPQELIFIGDNTKDLAAARAIGARGILVLTGHGVESLHIERAAGREPEHYPDLATAINALPAIVPTRTKLFIRSLAFNVSYTTAIILYSIPVLLSLPFGRRPIEIITQNYGRLLFWIMKKIIRLDYFISGQNNLPPGGGYIFAWKHQSTWETFIPLVLVHKLTYILKRELLWIPVVGWAIARLGAIGINRSNRHKAIAKILRRGKHLLARHYVIILYPEGHRTPPGTTRRYGLSGALLARECNVPIIPVAHNAADFWPRKSFIKQPGTVRVIIGLPISSSGRSAQEISLEVQHWIEHNMNEISLGYMRHK